MSARRLALCLALAGLLLLALPAASAEARAPRRAGKVTWVVRPGETLASVARRFHTTEKEIRRLNPGVSRTPSVGTPLSVRMPMAAGTSVGRRHVPKRSRRSTPALSRHAVAPATAAAPVAAPEMVAAAPPQRRRAARRYRRSYRTLYSPAARGRTDARGHAPAADRALGADRAPDPTAVIAHERGIAHGTPQNGRLEDPVKVPTTPGLHLRRPHRSYGTGRLVRRLVEAVAAVRARYPDTQTIAIGDLSLPEGGPLRGHKSHQSGLDADIAFYTKSGDTERRFRTVKPKELDAKRTWAFIESLLDSGDIQFLFIDYDLQRVLYDWAREHASPRWRSPAGLARVFQYPMPRWSPVGIIRHEPHHDDHIHMRIKRPRRPRDVAAR